MINIFENLISGVLPFIFLMSVGIYLTVKSGFFQIKALPLSVKLALGGLFKKEKNKEGVTPFQAACTALSATVGTGNIAGVAGAVSLGGAGAIFWMWVSAFAGMIVKLAEIILALNFREKVSGGFTGGPMYYIKNGLSKAFKPLAGIFAFIGIFSVIISGNLTQTNSAVLAVGNNFFVRLSMGILFCIITAAVTLGGAKRIGLVAEQIVPLMALLYILLTFGVIVFNIKALPAAFISVFKGAFNPEAVTGGAVGSVITTVMAGATRGVFSNEAGLGTSAMAHAVSEENGGLKQSLYGIFEVFADTIVICTLTALTILLSGVNIYYGKTASTELVNASLNGLYGDISSFLLAVMMCIFGIASVIGWAVYGNTCAIYLFGNTGKYIFMLIYPLFCIVGAFISADTVWRLASVFNGLMLIINMLAVSKLSPMVIKEIKNKGT